MEQDGAQRVYVGRLKDLWACTAFFSRAGFHCRFQHVIQQKGTEVCVIHIAAETLGHDRFSFQGFQQVFFRKAIEWTQLLREITGKQFVSGAEPPFVHLFEVFLCPGAQFRHGLHVLVDNKRIFCSAVVIICFKEGHHLLKGHLERISYIVKQGCHSPVFQKEMRRFVRLLVPVLRLIEMIIGMKCLAEVFVSLVNCQSQREDKHRMRIMIPVPHQKRTSVGFKFAQQLHLLLMHSVISEKDLKKTVKNRIGILHCRGIHELFQFSLQTKPVDIHLHIIGNLVRRKARAAIKACPFFLFFDLFVEEQVLTPLMEKTQRGRFQIEPGRSAF